MDARKRIVKHEAMRLAKVLRPNSFCCEGNGRNNWVFLTDDECISLPRDPAKVR